MFWREKAVGVTTMHMAARFAILVAIAAVFVGSVSLAGVKSQTLKLQHRTTFDIGAPPYP